MAQAQSIFRYLQDNVTSILSDVERLVKAESPSNDQQLVDQCGDVLKELFREHLGVEAETLPHREQGDSLRFTYGTGEKQLLIIGHFDTVWEVGRLPYRVEGNRAYGPGILDMKGGIIQALWAVKACKQLNVPIPQKVVFLCNSDEEIGSPSSREWIEREALKSEAVLVVEPAVALTGELKTSRKGIGIYSLTMRGKAAHAGNHHADGISAIEEMGRQIGYLHSLTDYGKGTTVNVGIAQGGTRTNIVAEQAELHIDTRMVTAAEGERIEACIQNIRPYLEGITIQVSGGISRPPMERSAATDRLFRQAADCAAELGFELRESAEPAGGGSDGNFTAALGIPTLDGLGSIGEGPHAEYEHIVIDQLAIRAALLANLLTKL
ncbi:MAG: peptidase family protein [Paenibacillus sp.]|nr:peptidase family protein [Paenibacillus sp.]